MARVKETVTDFSGIVTNPFGEQGAARMQHLSNDPDGTILYPNNARVAASSKFTNFPTAPRRALDVSTGGGHTGQTAILGANQIVFLDISSFTGTSYANGMANPSSTLFLEFDGGAYYAAPGTPAVRRFDFATDGNDSVTAGTGYTSVYGTVVSYVNTALLAFNSASGVDVYYIKPNTSTDTTLNTSIYPATRIPFEVVSADEYKNYGVFLCKYKTGSMAVFYDSLGSVANFFDSIPQGIPLFIRNVNGYLIAVTLDSNVNSRSLIFSVFDGAKFTKVHEYKKYNPSVFGVDFMDSCATADDGCLFFTGRFCDEHGMWKFDVERNELTLESYYSNAGIPAIVNYTLYNSLALPSYIGIMMNTTGSTCYQNTFNSYEGVSPVWVSQRFSGGHDDIKKKWLSVGVVTHTGIDEISSLPVAKSILIEYRTDNNQTWTTLGTHDVTNKTFSEFTYENTQITITNYYTIQFRLTWTGLGYLDDFYVTHDGLPQIEN